MRFPTAVAVAVVALIIAAPAQAAFPGANGPIVFDGLGYWESQNLFSKTDDASPWRQLTDGDFDDYRPAFSPDGSLIAFGSDRGGDREIYVMQADGSGVRRVTDDPGA